MYRTHFQRSFIWFCVTETTPKKKIALPKLLYWYEPTSCLTSSQCWTPSEEATAPSSTVSDGTRPRINTGSPGAEVDDLANFLSGPVHSRIKELLILVHLCLLKRHAILRLNCLRGNDISEVLGIGNANLVDTTLVTID